MSSEQSVMPRVCMLIESYYPVSGGMESQARTLSAGLKERGLPHRLVTRSVIAGLPARQLIDGIAVDRVGPRGDRRGARWLMAFTALPRLIQLRREYDLLFVPGFRTLGISAVLIRIMTGKPCVLKADSRGEMSGAFFAAGLEKYGLSPKRQPARCLMAWRRNLLLRADAFVSMSTEMTAEFIEHGVAPEVIHRIPNAVDTNVFKPLDKDARERLRSDLGIPADVTVFVFTGRLVAYKGLPVLLEAWKRLQAENKSVLLMIVGAGGLDIHNCEDELRAFVAEHGLSRSVRFVGETRDVHIYLQASDVFVFPTEEEAFGLSLIEAMACGLPVISTLVGGIRDILRDGRDGMVVETHSAQSLTDAMRRMRADSGLRIRLGRAALTKVASAYTPDKVCESYIRLFRSVYPAQKA